MSAIKIGNHAWFIPDGTTLSAGGGTGASSKSNYPHITMYDAPAAEWVAVPCLETASVQTEEQAAEEVYCPQPGTGTYELEEVVSGRTKTTIEITPQDLTPLVAGLIWGADVTLTDSVTGFAPATTASKRGWILVDQYSHNDVHISRVKAYGKLTLSAATEMGDKVVKPKLRFQIFANSVNAGAFDLTGAAFLD